MLSFSKFAVFSVLLAPSLVVASAQGPAGHSKPVGIEKVIAQLTKVKEEDRPKMVALFESFVHEWAGLGHLKIEVCEVKKGQNPLLVSNHIFFYLFDDFKKNSDLAKYFENARNSYNRSKLDYMTLIQNFHNMNAGQQKDQIATHNSSILVPYNISGNIPNFAEFFVRYDPLVARFIASSKVLLESSKECLLGRCTDETVKLMSEMKLEDVGDGLYVVNEDYVIQAEASKKAEAALFMMEKNVEKMEKFAQKIKNGTMVSSLETQVEKKKSECTALALGLGLGLGLGLPVSFALVLFVLFKNGRLSWRSTLDSQA